MDVNGLIEVLQRVEAGEIRYHAIDTTEPSPMAHEIVNGKPYTYLDDAPLEERRTRAVALRRSLPKEGRELGALDADAIDLVREQAWPEARDPEEAHDALLGLVAVRESDTTSWLPWLEELFSAARAGTIEVDGERLWFPAELLRFVELLYPDVERTLLREPPATPSKSSQSARMRGGACFEGTWRPSDPPPRRPSLRATGLRAVDVERGARADRGQRVHPARPLHAGPRRRCSRGVLRPSPAGAHPPLHARSPAAGDRAGHGADYMRFLLRWHHVVPGMQLEGRAGVRQAVAQLRGFEAPAATWELDLLPARVQDYIPSWLDELCLAGELAWARLAPPAGDEDGNGSGSPASRVTRVALAPRPELQPLLAAHPVAMSRLPEALGGGQPAEILEVLRAPRPRCSSTSSSDEGTQPPRGPTSSAGLRELIFAGPCALRWAFQGDCDSSRGGHRGRPTAGVVVPRPYLPRSAHGGETTPAAVLPVAGPPVARARISRARDAEERRRRAGRWCCWERYGRALPRHRGAGALSPCRGRGPFCARACVRPRSSGVSLRGRGASCAASSASSFAAPGGPSKPSRRVRKEPLRGRARGVSAPRTR